MDHSAQRDAELLAAYPPGGRTAVDRAEAALRGLGIDTRERATVVLGAWQWTPPLSRSEFAAVLARFARGTR